MNFQHTRPELTECDREAIHNIAKVQSFGGFLKLNGDWVIAHRSLNCAKLLDIDELPATGTPLSAVFIPNAVDSLRQAAARLTLPDTVERVFGLRLVTGGALFDCAVHTVGERIIIEFEPHVAKDYEDHVSVMGPLLSQLEPIRDIDQLCTTTAKLVRDTLGYDRVMIYKFHPDDSGEVIAEAKNNEMEAFLGLRYPAADIPQQARELFRRNRFRVIADIDDALSPVDPPMSFGSKALDMSMSSLRASSTIHLDYLRNMGVRASMTIAIVRQNKLWGLISCHQNSPHLPAYSLRTVAEMFSQMFSLMLDRILIDHSEQVRTRGRQLHDQLMLRLAGGNALSDCLPMLDELLAGVIEHDGASVLVDGDYRTRGSAPTKEEFAQIAPELGSAPVSTVIATNALTEQLQGAASFADKAAGALILPISRSPRDYLILWRKPLTKIVAWGGDPSKAVVKSGDRLQPRESFAAWEETVRGRSTDWSEDELQIAEWLRITVLEVLLRMTDETARERARAQEQQELLIAELNHRVRNILNLIRSLVSQSQHDAMTVADFSKIIGGRIAALASAHDNITRQNWAPAPLSALFETELGAYLNEKKERFQLGGEDVLIKPEAYTVLALVVHELVTNSAKYGSLCDRTGRLGVDLAYNTFGDLEIRWRERGGPPVKPPTRRGFGSTIIERSIPYELKGDAALRFKLGGLEADFTIPQRYIVAKPSSPRTGTEPASAADSEAMAIDIDSLQLPEHVLVVEDSMIIALDTEENLKRLGIKSVQIESNVSGALASIEGRTPDFAIVDFNLGTESSEPVAQALKERGVRFVLATGYAEMADQIEELGAESLLAKPYGRSDIEQLLTEKRAA